jgi:hypothetical protein
MSGSTTVLVVAKRAYGTGSLYLKEGAWYGRWRTADGRRKAQRIGPARANANRTGLTKKEAEAVLREILLAATLGPGAAACGAVAPRP